MNRGFIFIILFIFLFLNSIFTENFYIAGIKGDFSKSSDFLYTKDSYGNLHNISHKKNIIGWYLNGNDIVFLKDKNIQIIIKSGEKEIVLRSDGINPAYFTIKNKKDNIFYFYTEGYELNSNLRYSGYSTELIYKSDSNISVLDELSEIEKKISNIKVTNDNFDNYFDYKLLYNFLLVSSGNFDRAIKEIERDLKIVGEYKNDYRADYVNGSLYCFLGDLYFYKENYSTALTNYQIAYDILNGLVKNSIYQYKNYKILLYSNIKLAELFFKYKEYQNALNFYSKAKEVLKKIEILEKTNQDIRKIESPKIELVNMNFWITLKESYIFEILIKESNQDFTKDLNKNVSIINNLLNEIDERIYENGLIESYMFKKDFENIKKIYNRQKTYYNLIKYLELYDFTNNPNNDNPDDKISYYENYQNIIKDYLKDKYDLSLIYSLILINDKITNIFYSSEKFKDRIINSLFTYFSERELFYYIPYDHNYQYNHINFITKLSNEYLSRRDLKNFYHYELNKYNKLSQFINSNTRSSNIQNIFCVNLINLIETNYILNNLTEYYKFLEEFEKFLSLKYINKDSEEFYYYSSIKEDLYGKIFFKRNEKNDSFKNSFNRFKNGLEIRTKYLDNEKYKNLIALSNIYLGDISLITNKQKEAFEYYKKADELLGKDDNKNVLIVRSILNERFILYNIAINKKELLKESVNTNIDLDKKINNFDLLFNNTISNNTLFAFNNFVDGNLQNSYEKYNENLQIIGNLNKETFSFYDTILQNINTNYYLALINYFNKKLTESSKYFKTATELFESILSLKYKYYKIIFSDIYEKFIYYSYLVNDYNSVIKYFYNYNALINEIYSIENEIEKTPFVTINQLDTYINVLNSFINLNDYKNFDIYFNIFKQIINENSKNKNLDDNYLTYYRNFIYTFEAYISFINKDIEKSVNMYESALNGFKKLLAINNKSIDYQYNVAIILYNIGIVTKKYIDFNKGNNYLSEAMALISPSQNIEKFKTLMEKIKNEKDAK